MFNFYNNLKELLIHDVSGSDIKEDDKNEMQKEPIFDFLKLIYNENNNKNKDFIKYINSGKVNINESSQKNGHNEKTLTYKSKNYSKFYLVRNVFYSNIIGRVKISNPLKLIRSLLIFAYIYSQNRKK